MVFRKCPECGFDVYLEKRVSGDVIICAAPDCNWSHGAKSLVITSVKPDTPDDWNKIRSGNKCKVVNCEFTGHLSKGLCRRCKQRWQKQRSPDLRQFFEIEITESIMLKSTGANA